VAVDGRCGLLSCYWQAALSALTGEREIDFGLRTRCFIALHQRSRFVRADTVGQPTGHSPGPLRLHAGTPAFAAIGASFLRGGAPAAGYWYQTASTVLQNIHPHGRPLLSPRPWRRTASRLS
jgi:hypothetical protein